MSVDDRILFVTSFDWSLWEASAADLVRSFKKHQQIGRLLLCYEYSDATNVAAIQRQTDSSRVLSQDITLDPYLVEWDRKWKEKCQVELLYWNCRAWQWYRKIVSLRFALRYFPDTEWLVWLDCDCEFVGNMDGLEALLQTEKYFPAVFYFKGKREWTETGCMIFDLRNSNSRHFLGEFFRLYESGEVFDFERWDDCWMFDETRRKFAEKEICCDLTAPDTKLKVIESSVIGRFLTHKKGSHLKKKVR